MVAMDVFVLQKQHDTVSHALPVIPSIYILHVQAHSINARAPIGACIAPRATPPTRAQGVPERWMHDQPVWRGAVPVELRGSRLDRKPTLADALSRQVLVLPQRIFLFAAN